MIKYLRARAIVRVNAMQLIFFTPWVAAALQSCDCDPDRNSPQRMRTTSARCTCIAGLHLSSAHEPGCHRMKANRTKLLV